MKKRGKRNKKKRRKKKKKQKIVAKNKQKKKEIREGKDTIRSGFMFRFTFSLLCDLFCLRKKEKKKIGKKRKREEIKKTRTI